MGFGNIKTLGDLAWRDWATDGVPSSGIQRPLKSDIRTFVAAVHDILGVDDDDNTRIGKYAGAAANQDTYSFYGGSGAGRYSIGHANTCEGAGAGGSISTGYDCVFQGADAGRNADNEEKGFGDWVWITGWNNCFTGVHAYGHGGAGTHNSGHGNYVMAGGTVSPYYKGSPDNVMNGHRNGGYAHGALLRLHGTSSDNFAGGYYAGSGLLDNAHKHIHLGSFTGSQHAGGSGTILMGFDIRATSDTASNELNIGNLLRGSGLTEGGAPSSGKIGVGVPLAVNPANTFHVYNSVQAGIRLDTGAGGGLYYTDINQQTDGVLNIITPAAGYANFSGNVVVNGTLSTAPSTFPATFRSQTAGGGLLMYAAAATGPNFGCTILASHGTVASPTAVASGDLLATPVSVSGYDGNSYESVARLSVGVAAAVSDGVVPGYMLFQTANAAGAMSTALSIDHQQSVKVASGKQFCLGNAYQAGAPTATGYLLVTDSAGAIYEIPAKLH